MLAETMLKNRVLEEIIQKSDMSDAEKKPWHMPLIRGCALNRGRVAIWVCIDRPIGIRRKEGLKVRPKPKRIPRRGHSSGLHVVKFGT